MKGLNGFLLMLLSSISVDLLSTGMQRFKSVTTPIYRLFVLSGRDSPKAAAETFVDVVDRIATRTSRGIHRGRAACAATRNQRIPFSNAAMVINYTHCTRIQRHHHPQEYDEGNSFSLNFKSRNLSSCTPPPPNNTLMGSTNRHAPFTELPPQWWWAGNRKPAPAEE